MKQWEAEQIAEDDLRCFGVPFEGGLVCEGQGIGGCSAAACVMEDKALLYFAETGKNWWGLGRGRGL